ncbi:toll/interleukin-1 receptor domain-containing protein [Pararhodospirillum photometricum]|uniref:toll/interleukin-1 receptor domain-containing protein n=1 Tax=Pararhodospirillum photometricum TaxID=1084 RepID=UPI0012FEC41D
MNAKRVFLCHCSEDKEFVRRLAKSLDSLGIAPWLDEVEIKPGDSLFGKIGEGLASCDYLFAVVSANSITSPWVDEELRSMMYTQLKSSQVRVIPIKIDDAEMPWFLTEKKYVDFRSWYCKSSYLLAFDKLIKSFKWISSVKCKKTGLDFVKIEDGVFQYGRYRWLARQPWPCPASSLKPSCLKWQRWAG